MVISRNLSVYLGILHLLFSMLLSFHLKVNSIFNVGRVFGGFFLWDKILSGYRAVKNTVKNKIAS